MHERVPRLQLPFAILGAVVGWTAVRFLENPWIAVSYGLNATLAVCCGAAGGALIGGKLTRWAKQRASYEVRLREESAGLRVTLLVTWLGLAIGVLLGVLSIGGEGALTGAIVGALCGLVAAPLCTVVLHTALAAERARFGSIVARADRRAVWGMLAAAAAIVSLAALPDYAAWRGRSVSFPWLNGLAVLGALVVTWLEYRKNRSALEQVRVALATARRRDDDRAAHADLPRLDLGIGSEVHAQVTTKGASYRSADHELALIVGDPAEAGAALARSRRWARARLALVVVVIAAHGLALHTSAAFFYHRELCERHDPQACARAGWLLYELDGDADAMASLHARGCMGGDTASCARLSSFVETNMGAQTAETGLYESCLADVSFACCALARTPGAEPRRMASGARRCPF